MTRVKFYSLSLGIIAAILLGAVLGFTPRRDPSCVNIYYDLPVHAGGERNQAYTELIGHHLQHYGSLQIREQAIGDYQRGDVDRCRVSIYVGTHAEMNLPMGFIEDFSRTTQRVAWIGSSIWQLGQRLEKVFGYRFVGFTPQLRGASKLNDQSPFFRDVKYGGLTFSKQGPWFSKSDEGPRVDIQHAELLPIDESRSEVLAFSHKGSSKEIIPYILKAQNRLYVADSPFEGLSDSERDLLLASLVKDIVH